MICRQNLYCRIVSISKLWQNCAWNVCNLCGFTGSCHSHTRLIPLCRGITSSWSPGPNILSWLERPVRSPFGWVDSPKSMPGARQRNESETERPSKRQRLHIEAVMGQLGKPKPKQLHGERTLACQTKSWAAAKTQIPRGSEEMGHTIKRAQNKAQTHTKHFRPIWSTVCVCLCLSV